MMRKDVITKTRGNSFFPVWVRQRELGQRIPLGHSDAFYKSLYASISRCHSWDGGEIFEDDHGLFSLEFSPDGTLLVAGCENNSFLMFDPLTRKLIRTVRKAHSGSVTHVKFLDSQIFATGSVDKTVSLWDTRNLKSRYRTLEGHSSMIGNIQYSRKNDLIITSGLADTIYIWNMKNWNDRREFKTFMPHVLMRLRLNPDETKIVISTANGYLLLVHELDLKTIAKDLREFVMEMFEFANLNQVIDSSGWNSSRFLSPNRRRNSLEIVADFPNAGGFNVISALEIHPQGWSAFSRSTCQASGQEWTCVHDIQKKEHSAGRTALQERSRNERLPISLQETNEERNSASGYGADTGRLGCSSVGCCTASSDVSGSQLPDAAFPPERGARKRRSSSPADAARARSPPPGPSSAPPRPPERAGRGSHPASSRAQDPSLPHPNGNVRQFNRRVHLRFPRLTHYIDEPYSSDWYIDSLGVSADGRLVSSPLGRGIRLLAFSPECSEQSASRCGTKPKLLYELSSHSFHSDIILCTKFSPRHCVLVSGSSDGKLTWYQPVV